MSKKKQIDLLDYKESVAKIYFVRHGETKANKLRLLFGQLDWDLTKKGVLEVRRLATKFSKLLENKKIDFIITSPLVRARHTANIISRSLDVKKIVINDCLIEKSEGLWEGKSFWEVRESDPQNYYKWLKNPFKNKPPKGESILDLNKRVKKFYKQVLNKYSGKNIIVVAHSGPIKLFLLNLLEVGINKFWHLKVECSTITEVHVSKKHSIIWVMNVK